MRQKQRPILILSALGLLIIILLGPFTWIYLQSAFYGRQEIIDAAASIASSQPSQERTLDAIADWLNEHIIYGTKPVSFYPVPPFLLLRKVSPEPAWVMTTRRGGCEEYAILARARKYLDTIIPEKVVRAHARSR